MAISHWLLASGYVLLACVIPNTWHKPVCTNIFLLIIMDWNNHWLDFHKLNKEEKMILFAGVDCYTGCCHVWKLVSLFILTYEESVWKFIFIPQRIFFSFEKYSNNAGKQPHEGGRPTTMSAAGSIAQVTWLCSRSAFITQIFYHCKCSLLKCKYTF